MYQAFGDESCGQSHVAYGLVVIATTEVNKATEIISKTKSEFAGSAKDRLHCREMFAADARRKSRWHHLDNDGVFELYRKLSARLRPICFRLIATVAQKSDFPRRLPGFEWEIPSGTAGPRPPPTKAMDFGEKELASMCAQACMLPLAHAPGLDKVRLYVDPDDSKISTYSGKRKFSGTVRGFIDIGPDVEPPFFENSLTAPDEPVLLEIADLIAYVSQRTARKDDSANGRRFKEIARILTPERLIYGVAPNGGFGVRVPNASVTNTPPGWVKVPE